MSAARNAALSAVAAAENAGFTVEEDFSVTSTETGDRAYLSARQAQAKALAATIHTRVAELVAADQTVATEVTTAAQGLDSGTVQFVNNETGVDAATPTPQAGQPVDPTDPFVGDSRFGQWENVVAPPHTGPTPPLTPHYRPFPPDTPAKKGGPTEWFTPGRTWVNDSDAPLAVRQEQYMLRIAGQEATTYTRMVNDNGAMRQQRWVQNVFEAQHNTMMKFGGDIPFRGRGGSWLTGDIGGLPGFPHFGDWEPISLPQVATLSANNPTVSFFLPDGCGGQFTYENGVAVGGYSGLPTNPVPIMTVPR